jgi:hypothetical protein
MSSSGELLPETEGVRQKNGHSIEIKNTVHRS